MYYVYILNELDVDQFYVGFTSDLKKRLNQHIQGRTHSIQGRKWKIKAYFAFSDKLIALKFEKYLKSGSGRAFCIKHFT